MTITVVTLWVVLLGKLTHSHSLLIILVHVVQESKVIIGKGMLWIEKSALLKVIYCLVILLYLKVGKAKAVLQL